MIVGGRKKIKNKKTIILRDDGWLPPSIGFPVTTIVDVVDHDGPSIINLLFATYSTSVAWCIVIIISIVTGTYVIYTYLIALRTYYYYCYCRYLLFCTLLLQYNNI